MSLLLALLVSCGMWYCIIVYPWQTLCGFVVLCVMAIIAGRLDDRAARLRRYRRDVLGLQC